MIPHKLTSRRANPGKTENTIVEISVGKHVGQAVVIMILQRVQVQEFLHTDVLKSEGVGCILLFSGAIDLYDGNTEKRETRNGMFWREILTLGFSIKETHKISQFYLFSQL